jgi:Holliday junction resolvase
MMTGTEFEHLFCDILWKMGYWALNIPRDGRGAQPFDVIALKKKSIMAIDCKACSKDNFPLSRIEDNQWLAFDTIVRRVGWGSKNYIGIMAYYNGDIYYLPYWFIVDCVKAGAKSIKLSKLDIFLRKADIEGICEVNEQ